MDIFFIRRGTEGQRLFRKSQSWSEWRDRTNVKAGTVTFAVHLSILFTARAFLDSVHTVTTAVLLH